MPGCCWCLGNACQQLLGKRRSGAALSVRRLRQSKPYPTPQSTKFDPKDKSYLTRPKWIPKFSQSAAPKPASTLIRTGFMGPPPGCLTSILCCHAEAGTGERGHEGACLPALVEFCSGRVSNMYILFSMASSAIACCGVRHVALRDSPPHSRFPFWARNRYLSLIHPSLFLRHTGPQRAREPFLIPKR